MRPWSLALLVGLGGCARKVPDALRLDPTEDRDAAAEAAGAPDTLEAVLRQALRGDPLARRVRLPDPALLGQLEGGRAVSTLAYELDAIESSDRPRVPALQRLAQGLDGTAAVPLLRGYRLQMADNLLAVHTNAPDDPALAELGPLLTPLPPDPEDVAVGRNPLAFLARDLPLPEAVRRYGDRWALTGWLDGPDIPTGPAAEALDGPTHGLLRETAEGALVQARAAGAVADATTAREALARATALAVQRAAADRDTEQGRYADARRAEAERLGTDDPEVTLLQTALRGLTANASDDRDVGRALVAIAALRWRGVCDLPPCHGVDRTALLARARAWSGDLDPLVSTWESIFLKDAADTLEVSQASVMFGPALVDLVDVLLGTGHPPPPAPLLARTRPDADVWGALAAMLGHEGAADADDVQLLVGRVLQDRTSAALADRADDDPLREPLARIRRRALP